MSESPVCFSYPFSAYTGLFRPIFANKFAYVGSDYVDLLKELHYTLFCGANGNRKLHSNNRSSVAR